MAGGAARSSELKFQQALLLHQGGRLEQAAALYEEILRLQPAHFDATYHLATSHAQQGKFDRAAPLFAKAAKLNPRSAEAHFYCGLAYQSQRLLPEALQCYDCAIRLVPNLFDAHHNRASALAQSKRFAEALGGFETCIRLEPDHAASHFYRGNVLCDLDRHEEAVASYDRAVALKPNYAEAHSNRGNALKSLNRLEDSIRNYDRAIALKPNHADAFYNRALALMGLKKYDEALASCERAVGLKPDYFEAHNNRGIILAELGRLEEALLAYDRSIVLQPEYAEAHNNRGIILAALGCLEEALLASDRSIVLQPEYAEAHNNRGVILAELGCFEEALLAYDRSIALQPEYAEARGNKSLTLLLLGRFEEGWKEQEWRKRTYEKSGARSYVQPEWTGAQDIAGKILFVHWEQGLGDTIQFCRYVRLAEERGAKVVFSVQDGLRRLLRELSPTVEIIGSGALPAHFDYHAALLSLPMAFGTDGGNIPAFARYLAAEPELRQKWRQALGEGGFKIGVVWHGSRLGTKLGRSFPLAALRAIAGLPGVRLISLQKYEGADELDALPEGMRVETLGEDFDGGPDAFVDTAAVMETLDLVITTDTSIAHLAGALGRPAWVAIKQVPEWRWLLDRADTSWYPSLRLFRQERRDDWTSVFSAMEREIARRLGASQGLEI